MRQLKAIHNVELMLDDAIDAALVKFNALRQEDNTVTFVDIHIATVNDSSNQIGSFVSLIYEYDDQPKQQEFVNERVTYATRYIGMAKGSDPKKPETWKRLDTAADDTAIDNAPTSSQEGSGATEEQDSGSGMDRSFWRL